VGRASAPARGGSADVAAAFNDPHAMRSGMGAEGYRAAMGRFALVEQAQFATGQVEYLPAVSADADVEAAMGGAEPFEYYGTARSAAPGWANRVTRLSIRELLTFDAAIGADFLDDTPALIVHGRRDEFCSPAAAQAIHDRLAGPKELMWLDTTNHIDLYDQPAFVDPAVERVSRG
jgi:Hydrolases of the alpha/beta superfamily